MRTVQDFLDLFHRSNDRTQATSHPPKQFLYHAIFNQTNLLPNNTARAWAIAKVADACVALCVAVNRVAKAAYGDRYKVFRAFTEKETQALAEVSSTPFFIDRITRHASPSPNPPFLNDFHPNWKWSNNSRTVPSVEITSRLVPFVDADGEFFDTITMHVEEWFTFVEAMDLYRQEEDPAQQSDVDHNRYDALKKGDIFHIGYESIDDGRVIHILRANQDFALHPVARFVAEQLMTKSGEARASRFTDELKNALTSGGWASECETTEKKFLHWAYDYECVVAERRDRHVRPEVLWKEFDGFYLEKE